MIKPIPAGEFKARCLALMDDVRTTREPAVITKRRRPVQKLVPAEMRTANSWAVLRASSSSWLTSSLRLSPLSWGGAEAILLDPHSLVWAAGDTKRLSPAAAPEPKRARRDGGIAVSFISLWELPLLLGRGRIQAYGSVESTIELLLEDVTVRPITPEIAAPAVQFPEDYPAVLLIG